MGALNIEGTYQLVRRELPDGMVQLPPIVKGMFTYTKNFRNFSVIWQNDHGQFYSECYVARYTLTDKEYSETAEYLISDDQTHRKGIHYDLANSTAKSPVFYDGTRIRFALPQPFEKALSISVIFEGTTLTAKAKAHFIDYWEMVA
jgi:hypothetical protein